MTMAGPALEGDASPHERSSAREYHPLRRAPMTRANLTYYRAMCDRWRCRVALRITDWRALRCAGIHWVDRMRIASMAWLAVIGAIMETSVEERSEDEFLHRTRVSWLGVTLYRAEEILRLNSDGRRATIEISARLWPLLWVARDLGVGTVEIDEEAGGASYVLPWFGAELRQQTRVVGRELDVVQETDFSRGEFRLRRLTAKERSGRAS
jgi:hypothetical protein